MGRNEDCGSGRIMNLPYASLSDRNTWKYIYSFREEVEVYICKNEGLASLLADAAVGMVLGRQGSQLERINSV